MHAAGIDTASIDGGASARFGTHVAPYAATTPIVQNLTGIGKLSSEGGVRARPCR